MVLERLKMNITNVPGTESTLNKSRTRQEGFNSLLGVYPIQGADIDSPVVDGKHNRTGRRQARSSVILIEESELHVGSNPTHPIIIVDEAGTLIKLAPIGADVNSANDIGPSEKPVTVVENSGFGRKSRASVCGVIPQGASYSQKYYKIIKILRKSAEEFRPDFYQWILFNYHVYTYKIVIKINSH